MGVPVGWSSTDPSKNQPSLELAEKYINSTDSTVNLSGCCDPPQCHQTRR